MTKDEAMRLRAAFSDGSKWRALNWGNPSTSAIEAQRRFPITRRELRVVERLGAFWRYQPNESPHDSDRPDGWIEYQDNDGWCRVTGPIFGEHAIPLAKLWLDLAANPYIDTPTDE